jgi:hypothetical protein
MATPFDTLTIAQIQQALTKATPADYAPNVLFYSGDHWQNGQGWVGPQPPVGDPAAPQVLAEIKRAFVSSNKVKEITGRHVGGCVGREPAWALTVRRPLKEKQNPTQAELKLIDEAEALLTEWWDERGIHRVLRETTATLLLSSRAALRLFVPAGVLIDGRIPEADMRTALMQLYLAHPTPAQALVIVDADTQQRCGVYLYQKDSHTIAELTYLDEAGNTVLRIVREQTGEATDPDAMLPLNGQLLIFEMRRDLLITQQIRENQGQLNLAKTMMGRNVVQGGFLERIILNGQMPGSWVDDTTVAGGKRFVPAPFRTGAGTTNFIAGATYTDEDGKTHVASPSVVYRDPVKVDTFQATEQAAYRSILEEAHQLHALISGDATASGESRKQARSDFERDLELTAPEVSRAVRWLLETVLAIASALAGQPGRYAALRASCTARIDTGPLSSDEISQVQSLAGGKQLLSQETGMSRIGVEDTDAEKALIAAETAAAQAAMPDPAKDDPNAPAQVDSTKDTQGDPQAAHS